MPARSPWMSASLHDTSSRRSSTARCRRDFCQMPMPNRSLRIAAHDVCVAAHDDVIDHQPCRSASLSVILARRMPHAEVRDGAVPSPRRAREHGPARLVVRELDHRRESSCRASSACASTFGSAPLNAGMRTVPVAPAARPEADASSASAATLLRDVVVRAAEPEARSPPRRGRGAGPPRRAARRELSRVPSRAAQSCARRRWNASLPSSVTMPAPCAL